MRLSSVPLTAGLVVAASMAPVALLARPATALPAAAPAECGAASGHAFPIRTRIHGGPARYTTGRAPATWYVDLSNGTGRACGGVHPVIVLSDGAHALSASAVTLQLADGSGRMHDVPLVTTDRDELIGVLAHDTAGFAVPAGGTVTVPVRLGFAAGVRADEIVAAAAAVQRRGADGDWVGESAPYRFTVAQAAGDGSATTGRGTDRAGGTADSGGAGRSDGDGSGVGGVGESGSGGDDSAGSDSGGAADTGPSGAHREASTATAGGVDGETPGTAAAARPAGPQLAATGPRGILVRTILAAVLVACGAALVTLVGRRRSDRP